MRLPSCVAGIMVMLACASAVAQDTTDPGGPSSGSSVGIAPYQEYRKRIESAQNLAPLEEGLFGDSVNLNNGSTAFTVADIVVPGNNELPVQLSRRLSIELQPQGNFDYNSLLGGLGNWDVDVPFMAATYPQTSGWSDQRCSAGSVPPLVVGEWHRLEYWQGIAVHIPATRDTSVLGMDSQVPRPSDGSSYRWTTAQRDMFDCIPMGSGLSGEGFRMTTTSGVRYYFDVATVRTAATLERMVSNGSGLPPIRRLLYRDRIYLLASKVEDRFGNTVQYQYNGDGHPVRIWSSDGREIVLTYGANGELATASSHGQTWQYQYSQIGSRAMLATVILPDGSRWHYSGGDGLFPYTGEPGLPALPHCQSNPLMLDVAVTLTATHPSGAVGTFNFTNRRHYRSGVHATECMAEGVDPLTQTFTLLVPHYFDVMSLTNKTITGPGLSPRTWDYDYGANFQTLWGTYTEPAVYPCTTCTPDKMVTVTNPDGTKRRYRFGIVYRLNDGRQLSEETLAADGTVKRSQTSEYLTEAAAPQQAFHGQYGNVLGGVADPSTVRIRPVVKRTITQDGAAFTWAVNSTSSVYSFDGFARPVKVTKSSSLGYSKIDAATYHDDLDDWVLGQVKTRTTNGLKVARTDYDTRGQPVARYGYGDRLQQTLAYYVDGTLRTVADGRGNTTTLSTWKRGIPQLIQHADGTTESAIVSNDGTIASVTDENLYTTSYGYDAMGRLASITYPTGDSPQWNDTTITYDDAYPAAYGLPAGHWRKRVTTGNALKETLYDAMWRPVVVQTYDKTNSSTTAATISQVITRYDASGRTSFVSYPQRVFNAAISDTWANPLVAPNAKGVWTTYDALDRVKTVAQDSEYGPLPTTTGYLVGFRTQVTDPRGNSTTASYKAYDRPTYDLPISIGHPEGVYTDIGRNVFGKPESLTLSDDSLSFVVSRLYAYNDYQQLCRTIEPETGTTVMGYDAAGNLSWSASGLPANTHCSATGDTAVINPSKIVRAYDSRNRITSLIFPDHLGDTTYTYWPDGLSHNITADNGGIDQVTTTYTYNHRRLLTSERMDWGNNRWTLGRGYHPNGHLASESYPVHGDVDYAPNALGQPMQVGDYVAGISYFPNGAPKQFTYGNGIVRTLTHNPRGLPDTNTDAYGSKKFLNDSYDYDRNGNVAAITDGATDRNQRGNRDMTYDELNRLKTVISPMFGTATYSYDVLNNLTRVQIGGQFERDHHYCYDEGKWQLTNVKTGSCSGSTVIGMGYDPQGNLKNKNGATFEFDFGNRLRSTVGGGLTTSYIYDGLGRRVEDLTGDSKYSLYNLAGRLMFTSDQRKNLQTNYYYLGSSLVAKVESSTVAPTVVPVVTAPSVDADGTFAVDWTAVGIAERYELEQRKDAGAWSLIYSGISVSKALSGLPSGSYDFRVRACTAAGCGGDSAIRTTVVTLEPPSPSVTAPATDSDGAYTVEWTSASGATSYRLEQRQDAGSWSEIYNGAARSTPLSGLSNGTFQYRARACNSYGCSAYSAVETTVVTHPPGSTPTITAPPTDSNGAFTVSWTGVSTATSYRLEQRKDGGSWSQIYNGASLSKAVSGLSNGTYEYRARACNAGGCGGYSAADATVVTHPPGGAPAVTAPATDNNGAFTVTWTSVSAATSYRLEQRKNSGSWSQIYSGTARSKAVSGLDNGTYEYRARACNAGGCGGYSGAAATVVTHPPGGAPTVTAPATDNDGAFTVTWSSVSTATSYRLEQRKNSGSWSQIYSGSGRSKAVSGLGNGTYEYRARACNAGGCGGYSAMDSIVVLLPPGSAPTVTAPSADNNGAFTVTWASVSTATSYRLEQRKNSGSWSQIYSGSARSKTVSGLTNGTYQYRARACNSSGCSGYSAADTTVVTFPPSSAPVLTAPQTVQQNQSFTVSWGAVSGASEYRLEHRPYGGSSWSQIYAGGATGKVITISTAGAQEYRARACNVGGCGPYSAIVTVLVLAGGNCGPFDCVEP